MTYLNIRALLVCFLILACTASYAVSQQRPQPVPRLTARQLDEASYVELAKEWKKYIETNGETADALVNLGRAYDYSNELDAAVAAAKRAVEVDPDHPEALAFYGMLMASYVVDLESALVLLEHCREVAPAYEYGLTGLATIYLRLGELAKADEVFKTVFKERVIPEPLQDYGYNMLVGLPEGAILFTNGDNDTYPPLALQAGMGLRTDVAIVNMSLLNVVDYTLAQFERYPAIKLDGKIEHDHVRPLHQTLVKRFVEEVNVPIYFAPSVSFEHIGFEPDIVVEGINLRAAKKGLSGEDSATLIFEKYRMDSANDWNFAWSLSPAVSRLMANYVTAMIKLADYDGVTPETRAKLADKALEISEFHEFDRMTIYIKQNMR